MKTFKFLTILVLISLIFLSTNRSSAQGGVSSSETVNLLAQVSAVIRLIQEKLLALSAAVIQLEETVQPTTPQPLLTNDTKQLQDLKKTLEDKVFSLQTQVSLRTAQPIQAPSVDQTATQTPGSNSLIVRAKEGVTPNNSMPGFQNAIGVNKLLRDNHNRGVLSNTFTIGFPTSVNLSAKLSEIKQAQNFSQYFVTVEPDPVYRGQQFTTPPPSAPLPNDALFGQQFYLQQMLFPYAWYNEMGDPSVVVAVIDTGVDWSHPDLAANIWSNSDEIPNNNIDDDANGYIDDVRGWDFVANTGTSVCWPGANSHLEIEDCVTEDNDPGDFMSHGTHAAGIIAAVTNNGIGVSGVCRNCEVMPLRAAFAGSDGGTAPVPFALASQISAAIVYAAENGAKIINLSIGGSEPSQSLSDAIDYAHSLGSIVVAAAGNNNSDAPFYPASYQKVLAVAATNLFTPVPNPQYNCNPITGSSWPPCFTTQNASFTNYGLWIDAAAPGVNIKSTTVEDATWGCPDQSNTINEGYGNCSGTSASAAIFSGIAALAQSHYIHSQSINAITNVSVADIQNPNSPVTGTTQLLSPNQLLTMAHNYHGGVSIQSPNFIGHVTHAIAMSSVSATSPPAVALLNESLINAYFGPGQTINISGTASGQDFYSYYLSVSGPLDLSNPDPYDPLTSAPSTNYIFPQSYTPITNGTLFNWNLTTNPVQAPGRYTVNLITNLCSSQNCSPTTGGISSYMKSKPVIVNIDPTLVPGWPKTIPGKNASEPTIADVDGDGDQEIFFTTGEDNVDDKFYAVDHNGLVLPGWPQNPEINAPTSYVNANTSPAIGDLDNNGSKEIVFGTNKIGIVPPLNTPNYLAKYYLYNLSAAIQSGWPPPLQNTPENRIVRSAPVIAEIDGNTASKEVVNVTQEVPVSGSNPCDTNGSGSNNGNKLYVHHPNGLPMINWPKQLVCGPTGSPAVANLDDAGLSEIIVVTDSPNDTTNGKLHVFNADGTNFPGWPKSGINHITSPAAADIDENDGGLLEIVQADSDGKLYVFNHNGSNVSGFPKILGGAVTSYSPAIGDIDNNVYGPRPEIVVGAADGKVYAVASSPLGTANVVFSSFIGPVNAPVTPVTESPIIVNIDGVGAPEILIEHNKFLYAFNIVPGLGIYTNISPGFPKPLKASGVKSAAAGDLDGNGLIDIFAVDKDGNTYRWEVTGAATQANLLWPMFRHDAAHTAKY